MSLGDKVPEDARGFNDVWRTFVTTTGVLFQTERAVYRWANGVITVIRPTSSKAAIMDDVADIAPPAGHRLATARAVALDDLAAEPWITWLEGSICHDWLLHTLRRRGHEPRVAHTASEYATQLALVGAGLGAAVIPRLGRGAVPPGVVIVRSTPTLRRQGYAVWRSDATRRSAIRAAVEAFQAAGRRQDARR